MTNEELAKAFKACLSPDYEASPTAEQKRAVMADIMSTGMVFATTFVPGEPETTAFRLGGQNLALAILSFVDMDLDAARKERTTYERSRNNRS